MAFDDFPQKIYVTIDGDADDQMVAHISLEEAVAEMDKTIEVAEYVFNNHYRARAKVEIVEGDDDDDASDSARS